MKTVIKYQDEILYNNETPDVTFIHGITSYMKIKDNELIIRVYDKIKLIDSGDGVLIYNL